MNKIKELIIRYKIYRTKKILSIITDVIMRPFKESPKAGVILALFNIQTATRISKRLCKNNMSEAYLLVDTISIAYVQVHDMLTLPEQIYFTKLICQLRKLHGITGGYKYEN
ncbi:MAG: hypothetical protein ACRCX2_09540 [Paraclostridium sp.]